MRLASDDAWFDLPRGARAPRPIWAIGDIHGCTDHLAVLHAHLREAAREPGLLVYLGDYVDRGRDSAEALSMVAAGPGAPLLETRALLGNHDLFLMEAAGLGGRAPAPSIELWLHNGGGTTLGDLGVPARLAPAERAARLRRALGPERIAFLEAALPIHREGDLAFAHAGLDPSRPLERQDPRDLLWIREPFLDCPEAGWPFACAVIHGHTPPAFGVDHHRIGVDSGCYATGVLTMLEMRGNRGRFHRALI